MRSAPFTVLALMIPAALSGQAPDFGGSYSMTGVGGEQIVITLQSGGGGDYTGTMSNGGLTWQLAGDVYEDALTGTVDTGQGVLAFEAYVDDDGLEFILVRIGPDGTPDVDNGQKFLFARMGDAGGGVDAISERSAAPAGSPGATSAADPFVGTFSNGEMTLELQGGNGEYSGRLAVGDEAWPVSIRQNADRLEGVMSAANGEYGFFLDATPDGVAIDNAGETFSLPRVQSIRGMDAQARLPVGSGAMPGATGATPGESGQAGALPGDAAADDSPLAREWRAVLAGKKVTYISSYNSLGGGGMSTRNVYHLCSNGQFAYSDNSTIALDAPGSADLGSPGSAAGGSGTWRIVTQGQLAGVELRFNSGEVAVYRLDMQGGQVYANGDRVYVTPGEICP